MIQFSFFTRSLKRLAVLIIAIVSSGFLQAQTVQLSGTIKDAFSGESLIGANVVYAPGKGVVSDIDGNFILELPAGTYDLKISYIGYNDILKQVVLQSKAVHLLIQMESIELDEVMIVADIARERSTPIAFSSVSEKQILEEQGTQDLPMLLNYTPGVYATQQGGGDGDARINIRGFDQRNMAVMVDGIPVNDMENGWVYWSNWQLPVKTMQVQRGLSASKLALPSVGGTINVITMGIDAKKSLKFRQDFGSGNYTRSTLTLNTGRLKGDWGMVFEGSYRKGNGIVEANFTEGYSYYFKIEKFMGNHRLALTALGAPQRHGQRSYKNEISVYDHNLARDAGVPDSVISGIPEMGVTYNEHWGTYENYEVVGLGIPHPFDPSVLTYVEDSITQRGSLIKQNERVNFYHKPMFSLRDFWSINDRTVWVNTLYASYGWGGGTGLKSRSAAGYDENNQVQFQSVYRNNRINETDQGFDNTFRTINPAVSDTEYEGSNYLYSSVNNHKWYGFLSQVNYDISQSLKFSGGIDLRYYKGIHYREIYDMLGADYTIEAAQVGSLDTLQRVGDKVRYNDEGLVRWTGFFSQLEYTNGVISAFMNVTGSLTGYKAVDYFKNDYDENNLAPYESNWEQFYGYTIKLGANYNINEHMNVFFNTGHLNNAPKYNSVFNIDNDVIQGAENEKVLSGELGYAYSSRSVSFNVNAYYTEWANKPVNRYTTATGGLPDGGIVVGVPPEEVDPTLVDVFVRSLDAVHTGIEFDAAWVFHPKWKVQALFSLGDWTWQSKESADYVYDRESAIVDSDGNQLTVDIDAVGVHVGDAAQYQLGGMLEFKPNKMSYVRARFTHFGKNYSNFNPGSNVFDNSGRESWQIPNYQLLDFFAGYRFKLDNSTLIFGFVVNNLLNTVYISDAQNNDGFKRYSSTSNYDAASATIFPGLPRRYSLSITLEL